MGLTAGAAASTVPRVARRPTREGRGWRVLMVAFATLGALAVWELLSRSGVFPPEYIPPASVVLAEFFRLFGTGEFWMNVAATLRGWGVGLGLAAACAIPLGLAIGSNAVAYRGSRPIIEFLRPIPSVALIPLAVLVFGITLQTKVFLVTFASFWPILIQAIYGVQDVDSVARDTARAFGFGRLARFVFVTVPSAAPYVATGLRVSSSIAIILAITAELVAGVPGLGHAVLLAQSAGAHTLMYAVIVATGLLGYLLSAAFRLLESKVLAWHPSQREVHAQ